ncbi:MAG TPA: hypothetical protein VEQ11_17340 [Chloroflexota bacterium]|nr:hypothetical protein [Chloroflexota bacterium]
MTAPDPRPADKDVDSGVAGDRWDWARLNRLQLGRYAEYFVKMEFTLFGFDVYSAEVDDRGIDFVIRRGHDQYYDVQVKSIRERGYVFLRKQSLSYGTTCWRHSSCSSAPSPLSFM